MFKMAALRFKPVNKKHSIEDFFLGVRFGRQLTEASFTRAVIEARRLAAAHNLPAENQQANFLFSADTAVAMQTLPAAAFNPLFQRFNASGGVEEEQIGRAHV